MKEFLSNFYQRLNKTQRIACIIAIFAVMIIAFILVYNYFYTTEEVLLDAEGEGTIEEDGEEKSNTKSAIDKIGIMQEKEEFIEVHMIGEVNDPGVVKLKVGSRIIDAINAAGGATEYAELSKINLAYVLEDGLQVNVPNYNTSEDDEIIRSDAGESILSSGDTSDNSKQGKVNINTATAEKLQTVPGIGAATAQKIINYRTENGKFNGLEEIKNVPGIGDAKYENMKSYITT